MNMHEQCQLLCIKGNAACQLLEKSDTSVAADMRSSKTGLVGNTLDVDRRAWVRQDASVGAGIDSMYEYLIKVRLPAPCSVALLSEMLQPAVMLADTP